MKKENDFKKISVLLFIFTVIIISIFFIKLTGYIISGPETAVNFYFYDENTNCPLNGYLFLGNQLIGKTSDGYYNLNYKDYINNIEPYSSQNYSLFGRLGNCFNENKELYFDRYWKSFEISEQYFNGESKIIFKTKISPNNPSKRELLGFVQPKKFELYIKEINLSSDNKLENILNINKYLNKRTLYVKDWGFNKASYWQTPLETFEIKKGDCEDYSTTLLSFILGYDPSLKCYNVIFSTHVTTFCNIDDNFAYFDQGDKNVIRKVKDRYNSTQIKQEIIELNNEYFDYYGIQKNESTAYFAFDNNELMEFKKESDFIDWQYYLINKNSKINLFANLDNELKALKINNPETLNSVKEGQNEETSLTTQKPSQEFPSIKGFIEKYLGVLMILLIIFIALIAILIRIKSF